MVDWKKCVVRDNIPILNAIKILDDVGLQICLVTDPDSRLLGTVTDGDIRRGILRSVSLDSPVGDIMNTKPHVVTSPINTEEILVHMNLKGLHHLPVVNDNGEIVDLATIDNLVGPPAVRNNWAVIMAGGLGNRLRPLTLDTPKPLLKVGEKPVLETILELLIMNNFRKFYISVNYKAEQIMNYFGSGEEWGVEIRYLKEKSARGTAGALALIEEIPTESLVVMNGDLLTKVSFEHLLSFHEQQQSKATMAVREFELEVPFGVVEIEGVNVLNVEEKPTHKFFVNGGIYVFEPDILDMIPEQEYLDMPDLLELIVSSGDGVSAFPIREYWKDIGQVKDFNRAIEDYPKHFQNEEPR